MKARIRPIDLLLELTDWCVDNPYKEEIRKYEINKMIRKATVFDGHKTDT